MDADVVVLGAGPTGLAAAWRVGLAGHSVVVVERAAGIGGMAASFDVAGHRVDHGSHRLHPATEPSILTALHGLLGADLQWRPRHGRLRFDGHWLAFPLRFSDLLRRLPAPTTLRLAADTVLAPTRTPASGASFAAAVTAGLGPTVADHFYLPYARKLFGVDPDELDSELARRRVSGRSSIVVARRLLARRDSFSRSFASPRLGFGQIPDALADAATHAGATIRTGAEVTSIELGDDAVVLRLGDGATVRAGRLWSTIPTTALIRLVSPCPADDVLRAGTSLTHRAMTLAYLVVDRPRYTEFDAHYLPDVDLPVARLSEPKNYRDGHDPPGTTVLCAEVPCAVGDPTWTAGADEVGALVTGSLVAAGLPDPRPSAVVIRRLPHVYPVYRPGWAGHQASLERWAAGQDRLLVLGRQALFAHDNTHHGLAMAWTAAACLRRDGTFDRMRWNAAREGFRSDVVVD